MRNKLFALLLGGTMVLSLAACGRTGENGSSQVSEEKSSQVQQESKAEESQEEPADDLEPYTVTMWTLGNDSKDVEAVLDVVNERLQEILPNTTLEVMFISDSEYNDRWTKALAADEKIDIGWSANWVNNVETDVANGVVLPIEDLLKEYGAGIVEAVGGWTVLDQHHSLDGELYFVPCWQGLVGGRHGMYLDADILGLMPEGWKDELQQVIFDHQEYTVEDKEPIYDKLEEYLEVAKENDMLDYGVGAVDSVRMIGLAWTNYYLNVVETEEGVYEVYTNYNDPVTLAANKKVSEWIEKGYVRADLINEAVDYAANDYIMYANQAVSSDWLEKRMLADTREDLDGVLLQPSNSLISGFATGAVIPYTSENPERAMQVLNVLYTNKEIYQLLVYGIEGTHYELNEDGTISRPASGERSYEGVTNWTLGTCMNILEETPGQLAAYEALKEEEKTATVNPFLEFIFDKSNVMTEETNIGAVHIEYVFQTNAATLDEIDGLYDEWETKTVQAGMETYMEEFKNQLSEYLQKKNLGVVAE